MNSILTNRRRFGTCAVSKVKDRQLLDLEDVGRVSSPVNYSISFRTIGIIRQPSSVNIHFNNSSGRDRIVDFVDGYPHDITIISNSKADRCTYPGFDVYSSSALLDEDIDMGSSALCTSTLR